ncbi:hypothetical protein CLU88_2410 [Acidovorax sp. 56]|nr:hypothetical protein CLU88_2410 [Acidovorax sp. 56]
MRHIRRVASPRTPLGRTILTRHRIAHGRTHRRGQLPRAYHRPLSTARISTPPIGHTALPRPLHERLRPIRTLPRTQRHPIGPPSPLRQFGRTRRPQPVCARSHGPIAQPRCPQRPLRLGQRHRSATRSHLPRHGAPHRLGQRSLRLHHRRLRPTRTPSSHRHRAAPGIRRHTLTTRTARSHALGPTRLCRCQPLALLCW